MCENQYHKGLRMRTHDLGAQHRWVRVCPSQLLVNAAQALMGVAWPSGRSYARSTFQRYTSAHSLQPAVLSLPPAILASPLWDDNVLTAHTPSPAFCTVPVTLTHPGSHILHSCWRSRRHMATGKRSCDLAFTWETRAVLHASGTLSILRGPPWGCDTGSGPLYTQLCSKFQTVWFLPRMSLVV